MRERPGAKGRLFITRARKYENTKGKMPEAIGPAAGSDSGRSSFVFSYFRALVIHRWGDGTAFGVVPHPD